MTPRCVLTGANGFVGSRLLERIAPIMEVVTAGRRPPVAVTEAAFVQVGNIDRGTDWRPAFRAGVDVVVHAAGRAHVMKEIGADPLAVFRSINVEGTVNLARQAAEAGTRRFVFISSIGVNGGETVQPFTAVDTPAPQEPYAVSKLEAEQELLELSQESGMEVVIVRPPLVYGPNAPGNFGRLVSAVRRGMPLPLGAVHNRRTLVALDNLVDLIMHCMEHPAAANEVFLAGDSEDLSTTELLRRLGNALGRPARLLPVPVPWMEWGAGLLGRRSTVRKICGNLQVDICKARELLDWQPPVSVDEGLARVAGSR